MGVRSSGASPYLGDLDAALLADASLGLLVAVAVAGVRQASTGDPWPGMRFPSRSNVIVDSSCAMLVLQRVVTGGRVANRAR